MSENNLNNITKNMLGGARRKNGHKSSCDCHICENMRLKAKRGGYEEEYKKKTNPTSVSKKKNGHKPDCKCPICKNMSKKMKKGGENGEPTSEERERVEVDLDDLYDDDNENLQLNNNIPYNEINLPQINMIENENTRNVAPQPGGARSRRKSQKRNKKGGNVEDLNLPVGEVSPVVPIDKEDINNEKMSQPGGTRRRRRNYRKKTRKGGDGEPDIENQMGDIEEAGIKSTMSNKDNNNSESIELEVEGDDYNELDQAELGNLGPNKVGGTRRRRRTNKRKTRRNKKQLRRHRRH